MKKDYLKPELAIHRLSVKIMEDNPHSGMYSSNYDAPARHVGPAGL